MALQDQNDERKEELTCEKVIKCVLELEYHVIVTMGDFVLV
jgi:hypothetical protein